MTKKLLTISRCPICPFYGSYTRIDGATKMWCNRLDIELKTIKIPEECPLPTVPVVTQEEINTASAKKEEYYLKQMNESYGDKVTSKFAAMCCGNSFAEGAEFVIKKMK